MRNRLDTEYTAFYRPVRGAFGKKLMIPVLVLAALITIFTLPLTVPINILLRKLGRQGFFYKNDHGQWNSHLGPEAFKRTR